MLKWFAFLFISILIACDREIVEQPLDSLLEVPLGFPAPIFPKDNQLTEERWALGKRLFYDPILSRDGSLSCASCHLAEYAFSDIKPVSEGVEKRSGNRNAPTLANVAYHPYLTREGGVPSLEMQILVPIQEHAEFDFNILLIAERLQEDSSYVNASWNAYGRAPDPFVITRAISCFERTLISGKSRYDLYVNGSKTALTENEINGKDLFFSEHLACAQCHGGFNFTNYAFENNGLYEVYTDPGRYRLTGISGDEALFKVPTLRNIAMTAPYMHDGSIENLKDVIEHYNSGGKNHIHQSAYVKPLHLNEIEKEQLIAFLKSLTDHHFLNNPKYRN